MNRRFAAFVLAALAATGCQKAAKSLSQSRVNLTEATGLAGQIGAGGMGSPSMRALSISAYAADLPTQRFVAERHHLEIFTPESELQKSWESAVDFCGPLHCEVLSSSITARTSDSVPSGSVSMRVVPEDLGKLLAHLQTLGKIAQHTTEREDKTTAVVDTEAKIKNLTSFRDNLRTMLKRPSATVKDLVEIQQQLANTQSELDSETAQRKILANETEKIAVEISFQVERPSTNAGGFAQIWNALRESGAVLADSTASLLYTIFSIIPWLVLIVPGCSLVVKVCRKVRGRRVAPSPAAAD
jgi:hypothetical protein